MFFVFLILLTRFLLYNKNIDLIIDVQLKHENVARFDENSIPCKG